MFSFVSLLRVLNCELGRVLNSVFITLTSNDEYVVLSHDVVQCSVSVSLDSFWEIESDFKSM